MIIRYSPTGLEADSKPYDLGKTFEKEYKKYYDLCERKNNENAMYCLEETLDSMLFYDLASQQLQAEKVVYDVGANTNIQRNIFERYGIDFNGIDTHKVEDCVYTYDMIIKSFPFYVKETDACCISHLCLGYLIPINEMIMPFLTQFKTIIFQYSYLTNEQIELLRKYFDLHRCFIMYENNCWRLDRK